jgi:hypothetical protein
LYDYWKALKGEATSNEFGRYIITNLEEGPYTVTFTPPPHYKSQSFSIDIGDPVQRFDLGFSLVCTVCDECSDYFDAFKYQREWIHTKYDEGN